MSAIDDRLERGSRLLTEAGGDPDLLGVAMLAFHGAVDERLRELAATNPSLDEAERQALAAATITTAQLVELARAHGDLGREQVWRIRDADQLQAAFASGEPFRGSVGAVRAYGRFAAELCGRADLAAALASIPTSRLAAPPAKGAPAAADDEEPADLYRTLMRWLPGLLFAAVLAAGAYYIFQRAGARGQADVAPAEAPQPSAAAGTPSPTFAPIVVAEITATPQPTPTIAGRRARIVRLGGGPGWLHSDPSFDSPTLPIRLDEGQEVALLGQQQTDAQGTPWVYVGAGGYQGWSPLNNVEEIR